MLHYSALHCTTGPKAQASTNEGFLDPQRAGSLVIREMWTTIVKDPPTMVHSIGSTIRPIKNGATLKKVIISVTPTNKLLFQRVHIECF